MADMSVETRRKGDGLNLTKTRSTLTQQSKHEVQESAVARGLDGSKSIDEIEMRLRQSFDMETKYGPLSGMSRLERFERAQKLQLDPPLWVKTVIEAHGVDSDLNKHAFTPGKV